MPLEVAVAAVVSEEGKRLGGDSGGGQRSEVPAVEAVGDGGVHEEDVAVDERLTALPDGQRSVLAVALKRGSNDTAVDDDGQVETTDDRARDGLDVFHQRHATREVAARGEKTRKPFGRLDDNNVANLDGPGRRQSLEPDRQAR